MAKTEQAADTAAAKTAQAVKDATAKVESSSTTAEVKEGMANAKEAAKDAGAAMSATVNDAAITASVSAGLAKDPDLSAIKINVDTKGGAVSLKGPAPTAAAKARAEEIAKGRAGRDVGEQPARSEGLIDRPGELYCSPMKKPGSTGLFHGYVP